MLALLCGILAVSEARHAAAALRSVESRLAVAAARLQGAAMPAPQQRQGTTCGECGGPGASGCWCDIYCGAMGDCCADFEDTCVHAVVAEQAQQAETYQGTCRDVCGDFGGDCWCDAMCTQWGDCCHDYPAMCPALKKGETKIAGLCNAGDCGQKSSTHDCYCDQWCFSLEDCCSNFHEECVPHKLDHLPPVPARAHGRGSRRQSAGLRGVSGSCDATSDCGGQSSDGSCWCDNYCGGLNDCCENFDNTCKHSVAASQAQVALAYTGTCDGRCGDYSGVDCWCDDDCEKFNDCCSNFVATCSSPPEVKRNFGSRRTSSNVGLRGVSGSCDATSDCGGQSSDGSCWCDNYCGGLNDCCENFDHTCKHSVAATQEQVAAAFTGSCTANCGDYSGVDCWCDQSCLQFHDCCLDMASLCIPEGERRVSAQSGALQGRFVRTSSSRDATARYTTRKIAGTARSTCSSDSCGKQPPGSDCWCDVYCQYFGDCCEEEWIFTNDCSLGGSCEGRCGDFSGKECWCDDLCSSYHDCCDDIANYCSTTNKDAGHAAQQERRNSSRDQQHAHGKRDHADAVLRLLARMTRRH